MRLFLALEIPEAQQKLIRNVSGALRAPVEQTGAHVRWVPEEQFHVTLKFLGECAEGRLPGIRDVVRKTAGVFSPFNMELEGLGCFPAAGSPRVIWLGASQGAREAGELAAALEAACEPLGFPSEHRQFNTHVTLARVKAGGKPGGLGKTLTDVISGRIGPIPMRSVSLMQSRLSASGPTYSRLDAAYFPSK